MELQELPVDMMLNIFSRIPIKSLARCKCVSKHWRTFIDNPHLAIMHTEEPTPLQICLVETKNIESHSNIIKYVQGSCYDLLLFEICHKRPSPHSTFIITHPLRKDIYELPPTESPLISSWLIQEFHGLGFDHSTNTFKVVKVLTKRTIKDRDVVKQNLRTMVHVLGTRSWREIPNVPSYPLLDEAIFARGFLYWSKCIFQVRRDGERQIICFDVTKEEFGLINPPKERQDFVCDRKLFDLNGDLGVAYNYDNGNLVEVWVMKEKVWEMHCQIDRKPPLTRGIKYVVGVWNKNGDILIQTGLGEFFVFGLVTGFRQINIDDVEGHFCKVRMYTASLFSINGIARNPY